MRLRFWDSFEIEATASPAELAAALAAHTKKKPFFVVSLKNDPDQKPFFGVVSEEGFVIRPAINYRNDFAPVIRGRFKKTDFGTRIVVSMRLQIGIILFFIPIYVFLSLVFLGLIFASIYSSSSGFPRFDYRFLIAPIVSVGVYFSSCGYFWKEAELARDFLEDLFQNKPLMRLRSHWLF